MAKPKQEQFAEQEIPAEEGKEKTPRFRIGGAWRNEDKNKNGYLICPMSPEVVTQTIEELQKYETTGCKIITYTNGFRTSEVHPHFINYVYPYTKKDGEQSS
jgi:hypothetical protein